jgi:phage terminase small subunit
VKLTEKQKRFIDFYVETGNATESARRAGYSKKTAKQVGRENLTKPYLKTAIDKRLKKMESARIANATEVMKFLTSVMRGEIKEEVIVTEGVGEGCSDSRIMRKQVSGHDRLDAAKQLAKRYGLDSVAIENMEEGPVILEGGDDIRD